MPRTGKAGSLGNIIFHLFRNVILSFTMAAVSSTNTGLILQIADERSCPLDVGRPLLLEKTWFSFVFFFLGYSNLQWSMIGSGFHHDSSFSNLHFIYEIILPINPEYFSNPSLFLHFTLVFLGANAEREIYKSNF